MKKIPISPTFFPLCRSTIMTYSDGWRSAPMFWSRWPLWPMTPISFPKSARKRSFWMTHICWRSCIGPRRLRVTQRIGENGHRNDARRIADPGQEGAEAVAVPAGREREWIRKSLPAAAETVSSKCIPNRTIATVNLGKYIFPIVLIWFRIPLFILRCFGPFGLRSLSIQWQPYYNNGTASSRVPTGGRQCVDQHVRNVG